MANYELGTVQDIFKVGDAISSIELQIDDVFEADIIATDLANSFDRELKVSDWKSDNAQLLSGLNGLSISSLIIQVFVVISVVLAIASVLIISVVQKVRQIGILKAMGVSDAVASRIFILQGAMLGILGATAGIILGSGMLYASTKFALNPDGTPVIPVTLSFSLIATSWSIAFIAAIVASIIPSISSNKLSLMDVIKNG